MTIVDDKIAEYTAALTPVVATPTGDLGFGSDLFCVDDITAEADELEGDTPLAVAQANIRRLTTRRGSVPDDPNYGIDVRDFLNRGLTRTSLIEIPGLIRNELAEDDRNDAASLSVTLTPSADGSSFDLDIRGQTAEGPYSLTLAVTDGAVLVKEIAANGTS